MEISKPETIFNFYESNGFGPLTSHRAEIITKWIAVLSEEIVIQAMKTAIKRNIFNWKYVEWLLQHLDDIASRELLV